MQSRNSYYQVAARTILVALLLGFFAVATSAQTPAEVVGERLTSFNKVQSSLPARQAIHAGVRQDGKLLTLMVSDNWRLLSPDLQTHYVKSSLQTFFGMGGARKIVENPRDYKVEVKHQASGRLLATWDELFGIKLKN